MIIRLNAVQALALEAVRQQQQIALQAQTRVHTALAAIVSDAAPGATPPTSAEDVQAVALPDGSIELRWGEHAKAAPIANTRRSEATEAAVAN